ncbi:MAG: MATE family efflux transporter [Phycisphaerae bacterium]|nr:MATE family efflux transporter [Phycisphaerae bacterium]
MSEYLNNSTLDGPDETSLKYMLKLAGPMIITNISFTTMQFVDRFMVSRLGTNELAAVLPAGIVSFIPASFAIGAMTSVSTFVSQSYGRGEYDNCAKYCWQAIYMGLVFMLAVATVLWVAAPWIFSLQGFEPEVVKLEVMYLRIMLYSQFLAVFIWSSSQFFMGIHRPVITMYAALAGQVVNIVANYLLIFGKFGFPQMGLEGAAWGTFIGIFVGAFIRMLVFLTGDTNRRFKTAGSLKLDFQRMKDLLKIGTPAGFGLMVDVAVWAMIVVAMVGRFGKEAVAATSVVLSCTNVSVMPIVGFGTALSAAVGKSIGKGRKDIAVKQTNICLKAAFVYMGFMGLCFFVFREQIMGFWSDDPVVIAAGVNILICAALFQIFDAATVTFVGALRGAGDTLWLAVISAIGSFVVLGIAGAVMVIFFPQLGSLGPWIAATINIVFLGIANFYRFKSNRWMRIDLFKRRPVGLPVEVEKIE